MNVRGSRSREDIDAFLDEATIPIRLACRTPKGGLWMLSLWFRYREGRLYCATAASADVVSYLRNDPAVAFEVSTNDPPYEGVRGSGTARIEPDPDKELLTELLERYLGTTDSPLARRLLDDDREEVTIEIEPERVYGWDFTERMSTDDERETGADPDSS